ncbi:Histone H2A variant 1 [Striga hermonthica]|uniref:Histone H2A variant 1 n=1 Tax=Striga hermonthica TaxID=68872 RepID=A0A9N7R9G8_STRHE|nr:Histone H2A variant 1 [Striga hermonthica]
MSYLLGYLCSVIPKFTVMLNSVHASSWSCPVLPSLLSMLHQILGGTYASKDLKVMRITPRHLQLALHGDEELDTLIKREQLQEVA